MTSSNGTHANRGLLTKSYFMLLRNAAKSVPQAVGTSLSHCMDLSISVRRKRERIDSLFNQLTNSNNDENTAVIESAKQEIVELLRQIGQIRIREQLWLRETATIVSDATTQLEDAFQRGDQHFRRPTRRLLEKEIAEPVIISNAIANSSRNTNGGSSSISGEAVDRQSKRSKYSSRETSLPRSRSPSKKMRGEHIREHANKPGGGGLHAAKLHRFSQKKLAKLRDKDNETVQTEKQQSTNLSASNSLLERKKDNAPVVADGLQQKRPRINKQQLKSRLGVRNTNKYLTSNTSVPPGGAASSSSNASVTASRIAALAAACEFNPTTPPISPPGALAGLRAAAQVIGQLNSSSSTTTLSNSNDNDMSSSSSGVWKQQQRKPRRITSAQRQPSGGAAATASSSAATLASPTTDRPVSVSLAATGGGSTSNSTNHVLNDQKSVTPITPRYADESASRLSSAQAGFSTPANHSTTTTYADQQLYHANSANDRAEPGGSSSQASTLKKPRRLLKEPGVRRGAATAAGGVVRRRGGKLVAGRRANAAARDRNIRGMLQKPAASRRVAATTQRKTSEDRDTTTLGGPTSAADSGKLHSSTTTTTTTTASSSVASSPVPTDLSSSEATTPVATGGSSKPRRPGGVRRNAAGNKRRRRQSGLSASASGNAAAAVEDDDDAADDDDNDDAPVLTKRKAPSGEADKIAAPLQTQKPRTQTIKTELDQNDAGDFPRTLNDTSTSGPSSKQPVKRSLLPRDTSPADVVVTGAKCTNKGDVVLRSGAPDEERFCICKQVSYGQMVACDNASCDIEWFHFECIGLRATPRGKWYCPKCRGDKPTTLRGLVRKTSTVSSADADS